MSRYLKQNTSPFTNPCICLLVSSLLAFCRYTTMQVYDLSVLNILRKFCLSEINVRDGNHLRELRLLTAQLPSMWKIINSICIQEKSSYPPKPVCILILTLLRIRNDTFRKCEQRFQEDYFPYDKNDEEPTQFYPLFPLKYYPKI